jgi:vacuolar protein sorting-associated protein 13A/C
MIFFLAQTLIVSINFINVGRLEPPNLGIVLKDDNSGRFAAPTGFVLMMHTPGKGLEELYVWYPSAPPGYVTMGCVVTKDEDIDITIFRCVRADLVFEVGISRKPAWSMSGTKSGYSCSLWKVQNQVSALLRMVFCFSVSYFHVQR